jgi:RNA polymerase sigma-70 factor (ECF subfamily)
MEPAELERELRAHHLASFGWALSCCRDDPQTAEDVLHESYLRVLDGRARFRGESTFRTWLLGVIRQVARALRRRAALRAVLLLRFGAPQPEPLPDAAAPEAALRAALRRLPERQREVLVLVFYQDLSIAEAATALGIALGTALAHYERGKAALRAALAAEERR